VLEKVVARRFIIRLIQAHEEQEVKVPEPVDTRCKSRRNKSSEEHIHGSYPHHGRRVLLPRQHRCLCRRRNDQ